jgi:hypothetical protein
MALSKTVEWVFSVPTTQAVDLMSRGLEKMKGHPELSEADPLALTALTPRSLRKNQWGADWRIAVEPAEAGSKARLTVDTVGGKHAALLDELARLCGEAVTSREKPLSDWAAAREQARRSEATRTSGEVMLAKREEKIAAREKKNAAREAKKKERPSSLSEALEQARKRVVVSGKDAALATFDGADSITVRRGFGKKTYTVNAHVSATVESGGNLRTHPTLTRTVAGFAVTGTPIGAASWKKRGSLFLLIDGEDWAELIELNPKRAGDAQKFAQQVNLAARLAQRAVGTSESAPVASEESGSSTGDPSAVIDQLERLTKLREQGALTDEEFDAQKRRVLNS